jgi:hypothetical protein
VDDHFFPKETTRHNPSGKLYSHGLGIFNGQLIQFPLPLKAQTSQKLLNIQGFLAGFWCLVPQVGIEPTSEP